MARWEYTHGLKDIGNGLYAWLQPDGGWGWSNAGLIVDGDQSLLVDTLFDMHLTRDMLDAMADASGATPRPPLPEAAQPGLARQETQPIGFDQVWTD